MSKVLEKIENYLSEGKRNKRSSRYLKEDNVNISTGKDL